MNPLPGCERAVIEESKLVEYAREMKAKRYDSVVLLEGIGGIPEGSKGAVVEAYTTPYEAYDVEIVTDEGKTQGLAEGVRPQQIQVITATPAGVRLTSVHIADDGAHADVSFSDGTQVTVKAEELYARKE